MLRNYRVAVQLVASRVVLNSTELVSYGNVTVLVYGLQMRLNPHPYFVIYKTNS
jgi:hypothetical protein